MGLEEVLNRSNDFNSFVQLHIQNRIAISTLSEINSSKLQNYFLTLEDHGSINVDESEKFLKEIGFKKEALQFLQSTIDNLNSKYYFLQEDLLEIIDTQVRLEYEKEMNLNQRISYNWGLTCDGFCTVDAINTWVASETYDYQKFRQIHYGGCMNGCKNEPQE